MGCSGSTAVAHTPDGGVRDARSAAPVKTDNKFVLACRQNDHAAVDKYLTKGNPPTAIATSEDLKDWSSVGWAAAMGHVDMLRKLIDKGANIEAGEGTPLRAAAEHGQAEAAKVLLRAGASVNATDKHNTTALYIACVKSHEPVVEALLAARADPNLAVDKVCFTPLMKAARVGNVGIVRRLLACGADPRAKFGRQGPHYATTAMKEAAKGSSANHRTVEEMLKKALESPMPKKGQRAGAPPARSAASAAGTAVVAGVRPALGHPMTVVRGDVAGAPKAAPKAVPKAAPKAAAAGGGGGPAPPSISRTILFEIPPGEQLGIRLGPNPKGPGGVITAVESKSRAESAGLQVGDHLITLDGYSVDKLSTDEVVTRIKEFRASHPDTNLAAKFLSHRPPPPRRITFDVPPGESLGIVLARNSNGPGVVITKITAESRAEKSGLQCGDRLLELNGVRCDELDVATVSQMVKDFKTTNADKALHSQFESTRPPVRKIKFEVPPGEQLGILLGNNTAGPGTVITKVSEGTRAEKAGLQIGDRLMSLDGYSVAGLELAAVADRIKEFKAAHPDRPLQSLFHSSRAAVRKGTTAARIHFEVPAGDKLGVRLGENNEGAGVVIISIDAGSRAQKAGLSRGDRILSLNGDTVDGMALAEIAKRIKDFREAHPDKTLVSQFESIKSNEAKRAMDKAAAAADAASAAEAKAKAAAARLKEAKESAARDAAAKEAAAINTEAFNAARRAVGLARSAEAQNLSLAQVALANANSAPDPVLAAQHKAAHDAYMSHAAAAARAAAQHEQQAQLFASRLPSKSPVPGVVDVASRGAPAAAPGSARLPAIPAK